MTLREINISKTLGDAESLLRADKSISPQVRMLIELLVVIIRLVVAKLGTNSSNSSIPPSQDPFRRRGRKTVSTEKRKPGGQNGHKGIRLEKVENPDVKIPLSIDRRTLPLGDYSQDGIETRQVIDIKVSRFVTEYQAEVLKDKAGNRYIAEFPAGVSMPVQYGATVKAHAVYMSQHQLVPYKRIQEHFSDQYEIPISAGTVFNFNRETYELLKGFEELLKKKLVKQAQLHGD